MDGDLGKEDKKKKKKKKKKGGNDRFDEKSVVKVIRFNRGGKKRVTHIYGLDGYGFDMKGIAKALGKKFACGNSVQKDEITNEPLIQLLGDPMDEELIETMVKAEPQIEQGKFDFKEGGNKKGRKKGQQNSRP